MKSIIIGDFKDTGLNGIDISEVVKKWNHLWWVSEWRRDNNFRLIKYLRKDSGITEIKVSISESQARHLIETLELKCTQGLFNSSFSYRRQSDIDFLQEWRNAKYQNQ